MKDAATRGWRSLVGWHRDIEATAWGSLVLGNVWPAYLFALPLAARIWGLSQTRSPARRRAEDQARLLQEVVTIVFLALVVVLFAVRRRGIQGQRATWRAGLVALLGTFLLNVVAYLPIDEAASTSTLLASSAIVMLGTLFTIWSLATLGRCFGLLPEVRGLVLRGPYRLVRHPVYLGELIASLGLLLAKPHPLIVAMLIAFVLLQYWRTVYEERALAAAYPSDYPAYARRVPRLVPGMAVSGCASPRAVVVRYRVPESATARATARWLLGAAGVLIVLCGLPYVVSAWFGPADLERRARSGSCATSASTRRRCAKARQQSGWLIHDHFSAEPHPPAFVYPLYVGAGQTRGGARA